MVKKHFIILVGKVNEVNVNYEICNVYALNEIFNPVQIGDKHSRVKDANFTLDFLNFIEEAGLVDLPMLEVSRAAWLAARWGFRNLDLYVSSVADWFKLLCDKMVKENLEEVVSVMWAFWKSRNAMLFKQQSPEPLTIAKLGINVVSQCRSANCLAGNTEAESVSIMVPS
ncbi:Uncharacterized protein TCM_028656 [Theobroma cacao]|uniref:Uncharacterized protein n=1 Tax=Theobroma cacao TaxID=3641 RepID=A0A061GA26_THECC|nr:Uncharacterized protein TCM_028656 [Theobroma cacao]